MANINTVELDPIDLDENNLDFLRDLAAQQKIQYFNARFSTGKISQYSLMKKISKSSNMGIGKGFSIIAFNNGGYGFATGQDFSQKSIEGTFIQAAKLANWSANYSKDKFKIAEIKGSTKSFEINTHSPIFSISPEEKIKNLLEIEKKAYYDPRIISTSISYSDYEYEQLQYNNFNNLVRIKNSGLYLILQAIAKDGHRQEGYHITHGGVGGFEIIDKANEIGKMSAQNSLELLKSKPTPQGTHDLIMDNYLTGTFIHEAFGHAAEADSILAGESILAGKMNDSVGSEEVSIIDDGTLEKEFGFIPFDDEGIKSQKNTLVEKGILKKYLHNLETASRMDLPPTGNGRAGGYSVLPIVRMTNTYLQGGNSSLDEMFQEMKNGIYGIGWKYGYTDPITGEFTFKLAKAYLIEDGKKTQVLRDAAISGITLEVLKKISLISKDVLQDAGHCGKGGQTAPVGSGGPNTFIKNMVFGGQ